MNFADILNTKVEDIERPPLPPVGTYRMAVVKVPEIGERSSEKGEWDTIDFTLQALEGVTVDQDELEKFGGPSNVTLRHGFMFDRHDAVKQDRTKFNLRVFLEQHLGLDPKGKKLNELLNEAVGAQCLVTLRYRQDPSNPEIQYAEVGKTAPLE